MSPNIVQLINARKRGTTSTFMFESELTNLEEQVDYLTEPFIHFVSIRCVTLLEVSIRDAVREAVDHGEPYTQRGIELIARWSGKDLASALHAVHQKNLTVGDLAKQGFSTGRMQEIIASLQLIFGKDDFRKELATSRERWIEDEVEGIEAPQLIPDLEDTIGHIDRLLQVRHIVVHEYPQHSPYCKEELRAYIQHAKKFLLGLRWVVIARLYGAVPRTQAKMNKIAWNRVSQCQDELAALCGGKPDDFKSLKTPEAEIEYHWDQFCDLSAALSAGYLDNELPGSIAPCIYSGEFLRLAQWRINDIKHQRDHGEGDL